jgi:hypothetical protein
LRRWLTSISEPLSLVMTAVFIENGAARVAGAAGIIDSMTAAVTARADRRMIVHSYSFPLTH